MMKKNWLKVLVAISAITIAGSAAFFSVTGLGVLFSGAAIAVMIMAGSLEFAKLVTATYLKQEWDNIKGVNKWYLTSAVVILMAITSAGIFGYLSNAFQQQNLKLDQVSREISVWDNKIKTDSAQIVLYTNQLNQLQQNNTTVLNKNTNRSSLRFATSTSNEQSKIRTKISVLNDSIVSYNTHINDIKNNNIGIEKEVGGFRFVAESFGVPLNTVVKFFIILIVIVFDPLAVALVISFNQLILTKRKDEEDTVFQKELKDFVEGYDEKTYGEENKIEASDLIGEVSRLRLSDEDLKKLEEVLLNPPPPNDELKKATDIYNQRIEPFTTEPDFIQKNVTREEVIAESPLPENLQKHLDAFREYLRNTPQEEIDKDIEEINKLGGVIDEIINDNKDKELIDKAKEKLSIKDELFPESNQRAKDIIENSNIEEVLSQMTQENQDMGLYDEPFDNPMIDEEFSTIEPTEEDEEENFSTIEPIIENISEDNFTESEIVEEISQNVKQDEPEISEEDILENLNNFETETFSEVPTTLEIPEFKEDTSPFVQLPEPDETSIPNEEDEKKNF